MSLFIAGILVCSDSEIRSMFHQFKRVLLELDLWEFSVHVHVSDMHHLMIFLCLFTDKDACLIKWPSQAEKQSRDAACMQMRWATFPPDKLSIIKERHSVWRVTKVKAAHGSIHLALYISCGECKQTYHGYDAAKFNHTHTFMMK